ncbi:unnamed protein product, partial [Amoebophrya sp. A25]|eukprot:GSA25T00005974001.1
MYLSADAQVLARIKESSRRRKENQFGPPKLRSASKRPTSV